MNIMKLKRQNDQFAAAESHAKNLRIAHCEAQWFHSDFCKPPGKGSVPNIKVQLAYTPSAMQCQLCCTLLKHTQQHEQ